MESKAIVSRIEGQFAVVEVMPTGSGCGRCHEAGGCGSNLLNQSLRPKKLNFYRLPNFIGAKVGDCVVVTAPEGAVLRAAALAYLLPVLFLIIGAAIGTALSDRDVIALAGAGAGLVLGLLVLRLAGASGGELLLSMRFERPPAISTSV